MALYLIGAGIWIGAGVLVAVLHGIVRALDDLQALPSEQAGKVAELDAELRGLRREVDQLPTIWKDEADRSVKAEKRAAYHARRAEELSGGGGGATDADGVSHGDASSGGAQGMPSMRPTLVGAENEEERLHEIRRRIALGL